MLKHTIMFAAVAGLVLALAPAAETRADVTQEQLDAFVAAQTEPFRLIFVTSATTAATNTGITYYNTLANNTANNLDGNTGSLVAGVGVAWKCLGSTELVSAKQNSNTYVPTDDEYDPSADVPVYNLAGQLLADSNAYLWIGVKDPTGWPRVDYNEEGTLYLWSDEVWTGSSEWGVALRPFGSSNVTWTRAAQPGEQYSGQWMNMGYKPSDELKHLYALSDPIPEPATMALLAFSGLGVLIRRKRRA